MSTSNLSVPALPARSQSTPPTSRRSEDPVTQASVHHDPEEIDEHASVHLKEDSKKSGFAKRFVGNMLVVRMGRAGAQSVSSLVNLPTYLSPWGDNNPMSLPNVRRRDIALAGLMHVGADSLVSSSATALDSVVQHGATWTAEQGVDQSLEKAKGPRAHKVVRTAGITTVEVRIRHKLIGEHATLRFFEEEESKNKLACSKGWFCPYLYASGRTPLISRGKDFAVAELMDPGLLADAELAPMLLSTIEAEDAPVVHLCPFEYLANEQHHYGRLAVFFLGLAPYRTASTWSQARIPNQARFKMTLMTHIPAIVLPINANAPICAWSASTMHEIIKGEAGYSAKDHVAQMMRYLASVLEPQYLEHDVRHTWRNVLQDSLEQMVRGVIGMPVTLGAIGKEFDAERAGFVMFRY